MEDGIMRTLKESLTEGIGTLVKNRHAQGVLSTLFFMGFLLLSLVFSGVGPVATLNELVKEMREILNDNKSAKRLCVAAGMIFISLLFIVPSHYAYLILCGLAVGTALLVISAVFVASVIIIIASSDLDTGEACPLAKEA